MSERGPSPLPSLQTLQASLGLHQHLLGPGGASEVSTNKQGHGPPHSVPHFPPHPSHPQVTHPSTSLARRACEALRSSGALVRESQGQG